MKRVRVADGDAEAVGDESERRGLTDPLGASDLALNRYRIAPGEGFPGGLHAHADQEEVFVVLAGEATFATLDGPVTVGEGEAIRFAPGEYQSGRNDGETDLVALALGAPRDSKDVRVPIRCPDCGHGDLRPVRRGGETALVCPACGGERLARGCPACGRAELRVEPGEEARTVVVCPDCGEEVPDPFA
ncbi:MAG: cupin domain-containing protein [Haloferacaceae archaeon]